MGTMQAVINLLIQLQELMLIRDEQKVAAGGAHLESLNASITKMMGKLPADMRSQVTALFNKTHNAIVPESSGVCSGCGMGLPVSLVQQIKLAREVQHCPNCARYLYHIEAAPRRVSNKHRRVGRQKAGIGRFSGDGLMIPVLEADTAEGAIREMATRMEEEGFIQGADRLVEVTLQREAVISTAVDHGLAFPHARAVEGGGLTLALGISPKGIQWDPEASQLTRIVFFLVIPTAASAFYLKLLSGLTETFMKTDARKAIQAEKDPVKMWKVLSKLTRATVK